MNASRKLPFLMLLTALLILLVMLLTPPSLPPVSATPATSPQPATLPPPGVKTLPSAPVTPTVYLPQVINSPVLPPADEAAARLTVPPGFAVRIFAQNLVGYPRFMAVGPDNALYISLYNSGQIARLPDRNRDGLSDATEIVASGLANPHGLEWRSGWLYVAQAGKVERLQDANADGSLETRELVTDNIPGPGGHTSRTLHFGPDGLLYVAAGSSCNVCVESDPRRAAILRFNPDGSIPADNPFASDADVRKRPVWAWGLRNSVDFLWTPSGQLWADHNGRDNLLDAQNTPDTLPPEEIIIPVQGNKSHGWPYCYTPTNGINLPTQPEVLDPQSNLALPPGFDCSLANVVPALFTGPAHAAPLGMELGNARLAFPPAYQSSLYVAYHGSWNTTTASIRDCKVERILLNGETPTLSQEFLGGFRAPGQTCGSALTWGRPADVLPGADGALYVSDDKGGRVYRVVWVGP